MNQALSWPLLTVSFFYFCFEFAIEFVTHPFQFCCRFLISKGTSHLVQGKKKDATYIASLFEPWISKLDPAGVFINCVFLWRKQCPKGWSIACSAVPSNPCPDLCCSFSFLVFLDICKKLWQVCLMLVNYRCLYRLFGSGPMHSPYALFSQQSKAFKWWSEGGIASCR
jgi:hypothetical protein